MLTCAATGVCAESLLMWIQHMTTSVLSKMALELDALTRLVAIMARHSPASDEIASELKQWIAAFSTQVAVTDGDKELFPTLVDTHQRLLALIELPEPPPTLSNQKSSPVLRLVKSDDKS